MSDNSFVSGDGYSGLLKCPYCECENPNSSLACSGCNSNVNEMNSLTERQRMINANIQFGVISTQTATTPTIDASSQIDPAPTIDVSSQIVPAPTIDASLHIDPAPTIDASSQVYIDVGDVETTSEIIARAAGELKDGDYKYLSNDVWYNILKLCKTKIQNYINLKRNNSYFSKCKLREDNSDAIQNEVAAAGLCHLILVSRTPKPKIQVSRTPKPKIQCPICEAELTETDTKCKFCDSTLGDMRELRENQRSQSEAKSRQDSVVLAPSIEPTQSWICPVCSMKNPTASVICTTCYTPNPTGPPGKLKEEAALRSLPQQGNQKKKNTTENKRGNNNAKEETTLNRPREKATLNRLQEKDAISNAFQTEKVKENNKDRKEKDFGNKHNKNTQNRQPEKIP